MDIHQFYIGESFDAYDYFGVHVSGDEATFRVYAPAAEKVELIGEFNGWDGQEDEMMQEGLSGIFSITRKNIEIGQMYKYRIYQRDGVFRDRFDPFGFGSELRPGTATRVADIDHYTFHDDAWMNNRSKNYDEPMNIYEIHAGSWKKKGEGETDWYTYRELAPLLIDYVKEMGYTHVEILPLSEHPFDGSWGYQVGGYFCPTSRYGTSTDLMEMIDLLHQAGIGVIMDFVPVHFVANDYALFRFDGTALYEYPEDDIGLSEWGTCNFNYYRGEVCSFLQSAADFWLSKFHFDGIRMDAISNVLYWQGNSSRGVNDGAVKFLQNMNQGLQERHPQVMLIAEDSSNYPKVTAPVEYDGLGFDYKWDMGWMNDTLEYFKIHPNDRKYQYHKLTFSMAYFYNENYILPFSHDEVVHGKATILQKMYGDYDYKFQQAKTLYTYMFTHPGKKLNFMGNEIGMFREWDEAKECDWMLLGYDKHRQFCEFMKKLNHLYIEEPAFHRAEYDQKTFRWIESDDTEKAVYVYERKSQEDSYIVVLNMSDNEYHGYEFGDDRNLILHEVISGERVEFGGYYDGPKVDIIAEKPGYKWFKYKYRVDIPAMGAIIYKAEELPLSETVKQTDSMGISSDQKIPERSSL